MIDKYHISICVPGMKFNGNTLDHTSLGGSETAGLCVARELASLGHRVRMFNNCESPGEYDGVVYQPLNYFQLNFEQAPGDILIVQRTPEPFVKRSVHRLHILWCHDLALGRQTNTYRSVCWNVDKFVTVSEWMKKQYLETYNLPEEIIYASRNGIDLFRFPKVDLSKKHRKRLVYSARPERGLDILLERIFPALLERDPEFELALFGYDNPVDHLKEFYADLGAKAQRFGDKVRFVGNLAKPEQYRTYANCGIYAYPTPSPKMKDFREVSCISAVEAMATGMPIVTSRLGALPETIPDGAATLIDGDSTSDKYRDDFVTAIIDYVNDPVRYEEAANVGLKHAQSLGWDKVAEDWSDCFDRWIAECNSDRTRLAYHFYRRSDIFAANAALNGQRGKSAIQLRKMIKDKYDFIKSPEAFHKHYVKGGKATVKRLLSTSIDNYDFTNTNESRFHVIRDFLARHEECQSILDYGCGHGWSTIYLGNQVGRKWVGVDIDSGAIKCARRFAGRHGKPGVSYTFIEGDYKTKRIGENFDCLIMSEVLEHCVNPYEVFEEVEKKIKLGGTVVITVPYGPSEYWTDNWRKFRNHLWEFDAHDIHDMFGQKPDYAVSSSAIYPNVTVGEMVGYHYITFRADHQPLGRINMERKLRLQRPRETVSASIIAGPKAELTLGWCLASIQPYVDEIIIADTGLNNLGRKIARLYGAKLIKGSSPLETGFETPRNEALAECSMDWVLWIDTDEKLIGGVNLSKYVRQSLWHGLSIKQHHFSIDAGFRPDMPVRCFRRTPFKRKGDLQGKIMRHYGCVTPNTMVVSNPNLLPITEIKVGDKVLTHDGTFKKVEKLWQYYTEDDLVKIKAVGVPGDLCLTRNHELLVIKTRRCYWDHTYNVRCKSICSKATHYGCPHSYFKTYKKEWVSADEVEVGDWLLYPVNNRVLDRKFINFSEHVKQGRTNKKGSTHWYLKSGIWSRWYRGQLKKVRDRVSVDGALLRLIGYYVSDGWGGKDNRIAITFAKHEQKYAKDAYQIASKLGLTCRIVNRFSAVVIVCISGRPFVEWLLKEFGSGSRKKCAPGWVMKLPVSKQEQFLLGLWRGDGHVKPEKSYVAYTTVSTKLAWQIQELLLRRGISSNFHKGSDRGWYDLFARVHGKKFLGEWEMAPKSKYSNPESWISDGYLHLRVKEVSTVKYRGMVHDLTVKGNHSYMANRITVHNCIHEHPELDLNAGPGDVLVLPDVHIAHVGYLDEATRQIRFTRNAPLLAMDREKYPDRLLQKHFIMRDNMLLVEYERSRNGNQLTDGMSKLAEETVTLYREHFLGKSRYANIDSLQYYTRALQVLGRGIDVSFQVSASRDGIGDNLQQNGVPILARFETVEEAKTEIGFLIQQKFDPLQGKTW